MTTTTTTPSTLATSTTSVGKAYKISGRKYDGEKRATFIGSLPSAARRRTMQVASGDREDSIEPFRRERRRWLTVELPRDPPRPGMAQHGHTPTGSPVENRPNCGSRN